MTYKYRPLPRTRDEFHRSLRATGLPEAIVDRLTAQALPAQLLTTEPGGGSAYPLGVSRLGGVPDLPPGMAWPARPPYADAERRAADHHQQAERTLQDSREPNSWIKPEKAKKWSDEDLARANDAGRNFPLVFFGQFNLADLSRVDGFDPMLPDEGRLLVFYDLWEEPCETRPDSAVGWRVIWDTSPTASLAPATIPDDLAAISDEDWSVLFKPALLRATPVITPIPPNNKDWDAFDFDDDDLYEPYHQWLSDFGTPASVGGENHQLGGYPRPIQNGLQARNHLAANGIYCGDLESWDTPEVKALLPGARAWRHLLQIGNDLNAGMDGAGAYYVMIHEDDLAARRFERARVTYQCD